MNRGSIHYYIGVLAALLLLVACDKLQEENLPALSTADKPVYIQVSVSTGDASRTYTRSYGPAGGEEGDGDEDGSWVENEIHNLTLFFYRSDLAPDRTENGINYITHNPTVKYVLHIDENNITPTEQGGTLNGASSATIEIRSDQLLLGETYDVLVVANGDDTQIKEWEGQLGRPVSRLRDMIITTAWDEGVDSDGNKVFSNFRMVSAGRSDRRDKVTLPENPREDKPVTIGPVLMEHIAARIEMQHEWEKGYQVTDGSGKATIQGIAIVNRLTEGSCYLKRVADSRDNPSSITYLGKETENPNTTHVSNWVIDAYSTSDKKETYYEPETYFTKLAANDRLEEIVNTCVGHREDQNGEHWHLAGYALENVNDVSADQHELYTTGLVFKARFEPKGWTYGPDDDSTFFKYGDKLYCSLSQLMKGEYGENWDSYPTENSISAWKNYANETLTKTYGPTAYYKFLIYKLDQYAADGNYDLTADEVKSLKWTNFMETSYHYKEDNGKPILTDFKMEDRLKLAKEGYNRTYMHGFCYYVWWIKHNDDGWDEANGPMEYAIVRNNVYQIVVNSISTLGNDVPGKSSLHASVTVKKWNKLEEESHTIRP